MGIGIRILAGLAGTIAITISQMVEMKITKREASTGRADAMEKIFDVHPEPQVKEKL